MRLRWIVEGRVQGVGFRWWATREARQLGLAGWCRNLPDGTVEVEAEGDGNAVAELERLLHEGPPDARVQSCRRVDPGVEALPAPFAIRRAGAG